MENRDVNVTQPMFHQVWNQNTIPPTVTESHELRAAFRDQFIVYYDVKNGNFRDPNDSSWYKRVLSSYQGAVTTIHKGSGKLYQSSSGCRGEYPAGLNVPDPTNLINRALDDLLAGARASIDLSVDLAQAGQTKQMVGKRFRQCADYLESFDGRERNAIKRANSKVRRMAERSAYGRKIRTAKGLVEDLGSKWLEFVYGWKPLANTLYDTLKEVSHGVERPHRIRGRASEREYRRNADKLHYTSGDGKIEEGWVLQRCEFVAYFAPHQDLSDLISNFTSLNPVSIAWEAMPWSFVIDWFVNVGGFIRGVESSSLLQSRFRGGYRTYSYRIEVSGVESGSWDLGDGRFAYANWGGASRLEVRKVRSVLAVLPFPDAPKLNLSLGSGQLTNAAALVSQLWGRR